MVGVPRSGGCHTCRRRRIRCDQQRPHCQRCRTDVRNCEGYERWATFVNRTPTGLQKRHRLEEAILPADGSAYGPALQVIVSNKASHRYFRSPITTQMPVASSNVFKRFLELYLPVSPSDRGSTTEAWLFEAAGLAEPSPALRLALVALASSRVGAVDEDPGLVKESLKLYSEALALLSRFLSSPDSVVDDQAIAASRCLMLFEVLFDASVSATGAWESHAKGLVNIAIIRGPQGFSTPLATVLLAEIKRSSMVGCIHHSSASPLAHERWALSGEPTSLHELDDQLSDLGLNLASLYSEEEKLKESGVLHSAALRDLVQRMDALAALLHNMASTLARFKPEGSGDREFWSLESATITSISLTLLLDTSLSIHNLLDQLTEDGEKDRVQFAKFIGGQEAGWHEELGWRVVSAAAYMTRDDMGIYGATRAIFPLWMMINILPYNDAAYGRAEGLYVQMASKGKTRFPLDYPQEDNKPNKRLIKLKDPKP